MWRKKKTEVPKDWEPLVYNLLFFLGFYKDAHCILFFRGGGEELRGHLDFMLRRQCLVPLSLKNSAWAARRGQKNTEAQSWHDYSLIICNIISKLLG